ncbi:MAG TPA: HupE/UreJ family protein [Bryobacteraceae bacterium]|nr:HupE/UreJ family protein [Bryobacteraceae bacterium]
MRFIAFIAICGAAASGHDIPGDITVHAFVKPSGQRLQLLARVPLKAIRDLDFPERERGYLDVSRLAPLLPDLATLWISDSVELYENGVRLAGPRVAATRVSLESDKSFASFGQALEHLTGPRLADSENVLWNQVWFDALFEYPIRSEGSAFSIRPGMEGLATRVVTVLRFVLPGGAVRAYEFLGDPGLVPLDPSLSQAAARFVALGFHHILDGADHLLFLLCLVIPLRRFRPLILVVTAFTLAHSITLIASAYDLAPGALWFPPLIEALIAMSIVYMALENIVAASAGHRWMIAFAFGLVHGFGFSFALRERLQFAGSHLLVSLLSFNIGVELGQLLALAILVPLLGALFRFVVAERMGTILLSALVAHTGWHWMLERWELLRRYKFAWPPMDAAFLAAALRCAMWAAILAGALWAIRRMLPERSR